MASAPDQADTAPLAGQMTTIISRSWRHTRPAAYSPALTRLPRKLQRQQQGVGGDQLLQVVQHARHLRRAKRKGGGGAIGDAGWQPPAGRCCGAEATVKRLARQLNLASNPAQAAGWPTSPAPCSPAAHVRTRWATR